MLRTLRLWWIGYRLRHLEGLLDEALCARRTADQIVGECRDKIRALRLRAMNEVTR